MITAAAVAAVALVLVLVIERSDEPAKDNDNPSDGIAGKQQLSGPLYSPTPTDKASTRPRLNAENRELSRKLRETRGELDRARREAEFRGEVALALAGESSPAPETDDELASSVGGMRRKAIEFATRWPDGVPEEGTPERGAYDAEKKAAARDLASMLKWLGDGRLDAITSDPQRLARFQTMQLAGALRLSEDEIPAAEAVLRRHYAVGFNQGLNGGNKPIDGIDDWNQQRYSHSQEAAREITDALPPEKRKLFERVFGDGFLWSMNIGG